MILNNTKYILSYPNESILVILNDQNVSMKNGSKNMASFKKVFPWLSLPGLRMSNPMIYIFKQYTLLLSTMCDSQDKLIRNEESTTGI